MNGDERARAAALLQFWSERRDTLAKQLDEWEWHRPPPGRYEGLSDEAATALRLSDIRKGHERVYLAVGLAEAEREVDRLANGL